MKRASGVAIVFGAAVAAVASMCVFSIERLSSSRISRPQATPFASRFPMPNELGPSIREADRLLAKAKTDLAGALTASLTEQQRIVLQPQGPTIELSDKIPLPRTRPATAILLASLGSISGQEPTRSADPLNNVRDAFRKVFAMLQPPGADQPEASDENGSKSLKSVMGQTAVYDITARTVYMPDGAKLEAHSGLGDLLDDPSTVHVKDKGVTPPQVYELSLREKRFHGVEALRMKPVGEGSLYGRSGFLAHSYLMGPKGDSNGCVSFKDYEAFLKAYKDGAVRKIIVVPSLSEPMIVSASRT